MEDDRLARVQVHDRGHVRVVTHDDVDLARLLGGARGDGWRGGRGAGVAGSEERGSRGKGGETGGQAGGAAGAVGRDAAVHDAMMREAGPNGRRPLLIT
jgi:hypothetical protein